MKILHLTNLGCGVALLGALHPSVALAQHNNSPQDLPVTATENSYKAVYWTTSPPYLYMSMLGTYSGPNHTDSGSAFANFQEYSNEGYTLTVTAPTYLGPLPADTWSWWLGITGLPNFGGISGGNLPNHGHFNYSNFNTNGAMTATETAPQHSANSGDSGGIAVNVAGVTLADGENPSMSSGTGNAYVTITIS